jgi:hypothetical protein
MKRFALIVTLAGLFGLGAYQAQAITPQDAGTTAKQDVKDAGHDTKNAAKKTGSAVKSNSRQSSRELQLENQEQRQPPWSV